jgi:thiamine-monophosphate kinase
MAGEFEFINRIRAQAGSAAGLVAGIGDDAAVIVEREGRELLVTADLLVEDVHFKRSYTPPRWLGHKALAVSLSDIAAMGGRARFALLTLGIPRAAGDEFWSEFFAGYFALAARHGVTLIGGDTSAAADRMTIDSIVIGECGQGAAIRRNGARVGDGIYVTGALGRSAAGLSLLGRGERAREAGDGSQSALRAHLRPEPHLEFGAQVGERALAHAMIDISDGLAQDLAHICAESRVGAILDYDAVPVAEEVRLVSEGSDAAFELAISGGEDYELLLVAGREAEAGLFDVSRACRVRLARIGEIVARDEATVLRLRRAGALAPLAARGYDHFVN